MTATGSLSDELREHIHRVYADTPVDERRASHWVMDPEWLSDVLELDNTSAFGMPRLRPPTHIYGLPFGFRNGAGPPHLEPAP